MSRHINIAICEIVDGIIDSSLEAEAIGELWWDAGHVLVPSPGGVMVQGLFSVMCSNPILGHPPLVTSATIPSVAVLADKFVAERVVSQALSAMAEQRAAILAQQSAELTMAKPSLPDLSGFRV